MNAIDVILTAAAVPASGWAAHATFLYRRLAGVRLDSLTGLVSRPGWTARTERRIRRDRDQVLLLIDLDKFKAVNDSFGHQAGDAVLRASGARLAYWCGQSDRATRLGGDEFAAIVTRDRAARLDELQAVLSEPIPWPGGPLTVGASIGAVALAELPAPTLPLALDAADKAMYQAKRSHHRAGRRARQRGRKVLSSLMGGTR